MYTLQFDGLFRGIPDRRKSKAGIMCYGWLIVRRETVIGRGYGAFAHDHYATSNIAEYLALIEGLDALLDLGVEDEEVVIRGDAKCIIAQMRGDAVVNASSVRPVYQRAQRLAQNFQNLKWVWTPRRYNRDADELTRRAIRQLRQDRLGYVTLLQEIETAVLSGTRHRKFFPLLDLRVYQRSPVPTPVSMLYL